ncbi:MAG TPA: molybdopterin molybdotransferase MoeA [Saprospiraceae bacterium]|nr:molybdopterin molybdotransferase MoeA [Saprospiraceae bacterium]HPN71968.1 molybdopterin molybdotransferase MoeA [Saprospiraceae bacterium]
MISVEEALSLVSKTKRVYPTIEVPVENSLHCITAHDVFTDRDYPPFDRVTMDGIAICYQENREKDHVFKLEGIQQAGQPALQLSNKNGCLEAMTGAPLPIGCDTIIRFEDLEKVENGYIVNIDISKGNNIHPRGADAKAQTKAIEKGTKISALTIGVLASLGISNIEVLGHPKVAILSTGDELVDINQVPLPHQIRTSNSLVLNTLLHSIGIKASLYHVCDDPQFLIKMLHETLKDFDVILITGGVSAGKFDYVPDALTSVGVEKIFHKINQRPGKPFWFGASESQVVFAYPGNPMSCFICHKIYFEHWWRACNGKISSPVSAILEEDITFKPKMTFFVLGVAKVISGSLYFKPIQTNGSGDFISPLQANAIMHLPPDRELFSKDEHYEITWI